MKSGGGQPAEERRLLGDVVGGSAQHAADADAPVDRMRMVYIVLLLHGVAALMPWNAFITITGVSGTWQLTIIIHFFSTSPNSNWEVRCSAATSLPTSASARRCPI